MKNFFDQYKYVFIVFLISLGTFNFINNTTRLKRPKIIKYLSPSDEPWLVITENNNSHWRIFFEDTLKKKEYLIVDTTVKSGEFIWYWDYSKKIGRSRNSLFIRFYLNGNKLEKLNLRGAGCESFTNFLDPPYK